METIESIGLFFREGSSDKVYNASIVKNDDGTYSVPCSWGRRGSTPQYGNKADRVDLDTAKKAYDKVVKEKTGKGYQVDGSSVVGAVSAVPASKEVVFLPQLLTEITEEEVQKYINDDSYLAQEKHDGKRMALSTVLDKVRASNKLGFEVACPAEFSRSLTGYKQLIEESFLDGEAVGTKLYVFDLVRQGDLSCPYLLRLNLLEKYFGNDFASNIKVVRSAKTTTEKQELFDRIKRDKGEGIVFKKITGVYKAGLSDDQVKFKFRASATCEVIAQNAKSSIQVGVKDGNGKITFIGNCTIPPKTVKPSVGQAVEITYLYCYKGGCLYQPVYKGVRDDTVVNTLASLKYKPENIETDDEEA
jgi:bifunctional non-homologous end joining protein LigD